jgi:two-component system, chemotaxis family, chemotaxis protein CheY
MEARVLVVDDEPQLREVIAEILAGEGYRVTTAADGAQGLERLRRERPDLIVLDLMMPVLDGWAFIEAARKMTGDAIPIVGISASMTGKLARRLHELGVRSCLAKPFEVDDLMRCVERLLREPEAARAGPTA